MSELTPCNYCSLQSIIARHGKGNVRVQPSDSSVVPIDVLIKKDGEWKVVAGFCALTNQCAC